MTNRTANRKEILLLIGQPIEKEILLHELDTRLCYFLVNNTGKIILFDFIIIY